VLAYQDQQQLNIKFSVHKMIKFELMMVVILAGIRKGEYEGKCLTLWLQSS